MVDTTCKADWTAVLNGYQAARRGDPWDPHETQDFRTGYIFYLRESGEPVPHYWENPHSLH